MLIQAQHRRFVDLTWIPYRDPSNATFTIVLVTSEDPVLISNGTVCNDQDCSGWAGAPSRLASTISIPDSLSGQDAVMTVQMQYQTLVCMLCRQLAVEVS